MRAGIFENYGSRLSKSMGYEWRMERRDVGMRIKWIKEVSVRLKKRETVTRVGDRQWRAPLYPRHDSALNRSHPFTARTNVIRSDPTRSDPIRYPSSHVGSSPASKLAFAPLSISLALSFSFLSAWKSSLPPVPVGGVNQTSSLRSFGVCSFHVLSTASETVILANWPFPIFENEFFNGWNY